MPVGMKSPTLTLALTACLIGAATAQQADDHPINLEERKASIPILEEHLKEREARLADIASDIIRIDQRLEGNVDKIVKKLASISDSEKSGYRVSQVKMDAMKGLARSIQNYQSKRATLIQEVREGRSGIPDEVLESDAAKFDERIEKRVNQILDLSKSFTQDQDVEKYQKVSGGGYSWNGWNEDLYEISDDYRQNRRDRTSDKKQNTEVMEALKKSIERHESLIAGMKDSLANRTMSKSDRTLMELELKRNEEILATRKDQFREMIEVGQPATSPLDRSAAQDLEEALKDASSDLRQDFETIFVKYSELNRERQTIFKLKANLEARKKWIDDYVKEHGDTKS